MKVDHGHFDGVVKITSERIVRVFAKRADRRREARDGAAEYPAFFGGGIADFGLIHAVAPNQIRRDFGRSAHFKKISECEAESPFFLIQAESFTTNGEGGFRLALGGREFCGDAGDFLLGGGLLIE